MSVVPFLRPPCRLYNRPMFCCCVCGCAVENLSFKKESWINNRRQHKRHVGSEWQRGQASRAVDGDVDGALQRCIALDNFYVERPTLKIDIGRRTVVTGLVIVTWQGKGQGDAEKNRHARTLTYRRRHFTGDRNFHELIFISPPPLASKRSVGSPWRNLFLQKCMRVFCW